MIMIQQDVCGVTVPVFTVFNLLPSRIFDGQVTKTKRQPVIYSVNSFPNPEKVVCNINL